ncbi:MAG: hypothetical protein C5B60_07535, partial [Chloroflexi bacterium]
MLFPLILGYSLVLVYSYPTSLVHPASPITPSGLNTQVTLAPTPPPGKIQYDITGGTRPGGGPNLFHSFGNFNVPNNNIANFLNNSGLPTSNILGRVTGGNLSTIFGTIQTTGFGTANLFLMNPAGFLFGPNATINVGGMVSFTSADYLRLADGARFNAVPNASADALLSTAPVAAFGFLGSNPGAITVQGSQLSVTPGQSISLVGGNITVQSGVLDDGVTIQPARLVAPGGQINLASVASAGEIIQSQPNQTPSLTPTPNTSLGRIGVTDATLDVSGVGGGTIQIRSGQLVMKNPNIQSTTVTLNGGDISIVSSSIDMDGGIIQTASVGPGNAGNITVDTGTLSMTNGALLSNMLLPNPALPGAGAGGNISVHASDSITISGLRPGVFFFGPVPQTNLPSGIYTQTFTEATGGSISITTPNLNLKGGVVDTLTFGPGNAGDNTHVLDRLSMTDGALLSTVTFGTGNGGTVNVSATDSIEVVGRRDGLLGVAGLTFVNLPSGIDADTYVAGKGGNIFVSTPTLNLRTGVIAANSYGVGRGGEINVRTGNLTITGGSGITSTAFSDGPGGNVTVAASGDITIFGRSGSFFSAGPLVFVDNQSGIASAAFGKGQSGNVTVSARNIVMFDEGIIQAAAGGDGAAGNISVTADNISLSGSAKITSSSGLILGDAVIGGNGPGGAVTITTNDAFTISGKGSGVLSSTVGSGAGGTIDITASKLEITDQGAISAQTLGAGKAGNINIAANTFNMDGKGSSVLTNTEGAGAGGNIDILAQSLSLHNGALLSASTSGTVPSAAGGSITMSVGQSVTLNNGASITASSTGPGKAGNISINAGNQFAMTNSTVTTEADFSSGGAIKIATTPNGTVQLTNSKISASVLDGTGGGGSVNIDPQFVLLQNSQILANAVFGPGGNIFITTNLLQPDATSIISA